MPIQDDAIRTLVAGAKRCLQFQAAGDYLRTKREFAIEMKAMDSDRRRSPRYRFIADVEIIEAVSEARLKARTSDLSIGGCFLDMLNPSPIGKYIEVRIFHAGTTFIAIGRVAFVVPNMGMGVAFTNVDDHQVAVLQKWLAEVGK